MGDLLHPPDRNHALGRKPDWNTDMKCLPLVTMILFLCSASGLAAADDVPRTIDDDGPTQGTQRLPLNELWRVGGEDDDLIFGRITDLQDASGR